MEDKKGFDFDVLLKRTMKENNSNMKLVKKNEKPKKVDKIGIKNVQVMNSKNIERREK